MKAKNLLMLLILACLWGPSFLLIKIAVAEIPPITLIAGRVGLASIILYTILRLSGGKLPRPGRIWLSLAVVALFQTSLPFVLLSWAEQHIDSALAAILVGATPCLTKMSRKNSEGASIISAWFSAFISSWRRSAIFHAAAAWRQRGRRCRQAGI